MEAFRRVVEHVFGNWSAMQLAVEHGMGSPEGKQTVIDTVVSYCFTNENIGVEDIEDTLENVIDQHFNTICEDGSIKEVADILYKFLELLRQGNFAQCEIEYSNLPVNDGWMKSIQTVQSSESIEEEIRPSRSHDPVKFRCEELMEPEEPGWTRVAGKRKNK